MFKKSMFILTILTLIASFTLVGMGKEETYDGPPTMVITSSNFLQNQIAHAPATIHFHAKISNPEQVEEFVWDLGNGKKQVGETIKYTYHKKDVYTIRLKIFFKDGRTKIITDRIHILSGWIDWDMWVNTLRDALIALAGIGLLPQLF